MRLFAFALLLATIPTIAQTPTDARGWLNQGIAEFKAGQYL